MKKNIVKNVKNVTGDINELIIIFNIFNKFCLKLKNNDFLMSI